MEHASNIDLDNPEFQAIWNLIRYTNQSVFMTGKAGTGKSTFLRYICANTTKKHVILAPTGIAAVNVGGQTLHSFFRLPFKPLLTTDPDFARDRIKKRLKYSSSHIKLLRELELIVIDEISMVRADIIDFIDKILRVYTGNHRQAFGGKQMLIVGDIFQLEPVLTGDIRDILSREYTIPYFFNAHVFHQTELVPIELRKVYRQTDSTLLSMLDRIRVGHPLPTDINLLNSRITHPDSDRSNDDMVMTLATKREMVDSINSRHLDELATPAVTYIGSVNKDFPENSYPNAIELTLKVGAQVVFIKNDIDKRWVNGTLGKVYATNTDNVVIETENGEKHTVDMAVWNNIKYRYDEKSKKVTEEVVGTFTQYPVKLAWALTIHKSQGLTFNRVRVDIGTGTFSSGQAYVALSRCRTLEGLNLVSTINERDIFVHPAIVRFSQHFNDNSLVDKSLRDAQAESDYIEALNRFRDNDLPGAFGMFMKALSAKDCRNDALMLRFIRRQLSGHDSAQSRIARLEDEIKQYKDRFRQLAAEYTRLGDDCRSDWEDPTPALANYNKALSLDPGSVDAWLGKGLTLLGVGQFDEAEAALLEVRRLDPQNFTAPFRLGQSYHRNGDDILALDWLKVALRIDDRNPSLHLLLSDVYHDLGDDINAEKHEKKARSLTRRRNNKQ